MVGVDHGLEAGGYPTVDKSDTWTWADFCFPRGGGRGDDREEGGGGDRGFADPSGPGVRRKGVSTERRKQVVHLKGQSARETCPSLVPRTVPKFGVYGDV